MQTKLGAKLNILGERSCEAVMGKEEIKPPANNNQVKVHQPLAMQNHLPKRTMQHQPSQADTLDHAQLLPSSRELTAMPQQQQEPQQQPRMQFQQAMDDIASEPSAANEMGGLFEVVHGNLFTIKYSTKTVF